MVQKQAEKMGAGGCGPHVLPTPALVWWPGGSPSLGSFLSLLQATGTSGERVGGRATILHPSSELAVVVVEGLERGPQSPLCLEAIEMCCNPWWHLVLSCTRP